MDSMSHLFNGEIKDWGGFDVYPSICWDSLKAYGSSALRGHCWAREIYAIRLPLRIGCMCTHGWKPYTNLIPLFIHPHSDHGEKLYMVTMVVNTMWNVNIKLWIKLLLDYQSLRCSSSTIWRLSQWTKTYFIWIPYAKVIRAQNCIDRKTNMRTCC